MSASDGGLSLRLSADEANGLRAIAEPRNRSIEDLAHELIAERLDCEKKRSMAMAVIDSLGGQWPENSGDPESAFHDAMWPEDWRTDHLRTILRGAAYLDALLSQILERHFANPRIQNLERRPFLEKVRMTYAIGAIDAEMLTSLKIVADIRNGFAHEIGRRLEHIEVQRLCASLRGRARELFACYTGGSSKSPQRLRHALTVMKIVLEEIAFPDKPRDYAWFDAALAARRLGN